MTRLLPSQDVHVIYNSHVINIEQIKDNSLIIHTKDGRTHTADKVIVTVPLSILKDKVIKFIPSLSPDKELAINRLGAGLVEKVALKFSRPFWRDKLKNLDIFGRVSTQTSQRGLFSVFYDISNDTSFILVTTVSGQALEYYHTLSDEEVKNECLVILKDMFPERPIEEPLSYIASRWSKSPHIRMSYSYVGVGGAAEDYDIMCRQEMCGRLHFAGEATNRRHPQSVTGAYLSGIREACKIIEDDWSNSLGK
jgi:lysine-specific histone demethylase 1B